MLEPASVALADEASLLSVFKDVVAVNFGDYGAATTAMSLSGDKPTLIVAAWHKHA